MESDKHTRNFIVLMSLMTLFAMGIAIVPHKNTVMPLYVSQTKVEIESPLMNQVVDGIHLPTGLIADQNFELVVSNCTACHTSKLITQNRQTADGWKSIIEWMKEKQNLWDLGNDETKIIAYLAKNYAPENEGRRKNLSLKTDDWYVLE